MRAPAIRLYEGEIIVDSFAGGGGASLGIEWALGRSPDIAINHDADAIAMHATNHPRTRHYCEDVWDVNPREATAGRPVGLMWLSPDCKHHSKAKGGKPVDKQIRGLAWVAVRWARDLGARAPRVIILENVEEFQHWGPLDEDNKPDKLKKGLTFRRFVRQLENLGYKVDWRELVAADYGAPTSRKRLFLIARRDGLPIAWPEPTHGPGRIQPWRTAAECIDFSIPCPSIFERARPLAHNTLRRVARGVQRFVIDAPEPFIVPVTHPTDQRVHSIREPLRTITGANRGELALCSPTLIQTGYDERPGQAPRVPGLHKPLGTLVDGQKHALVAAFLAKHNGGHEATGQDLFGPVHTVMATDQKSLVASSLVKLRGTAQHGQPLDVPLHTVSAQGNHFAEVRAFLLGFYSGDRSGGQGSACGLPAPTLTTKDRLGLVLVQGTLHAIVDIGLRMLQPPELFLAQSFPSSYIIDRTADGRIFPKHVQVRMVGNSVPPVMAAALTRANFAVGAEARVA